MSNNIQNLFKGAVQSGELSGMAVSNLNIRDIGAEIQAGLGVAPDDVPASEVTLVTGLYDDSGSIRFVAGNAQAVRDGHNGLLDALGASKQSTGILVLARYLNGTLLYPYSTLAQAVRMDSHNFDPMGGTPLYDQTAVALATAVAKMKEFSDNGVPARSITVIVTDGHDEGSRKQTASSLRPVIEELLHTEAHIIAGMGINDGLTDFKQVFGEMGIRDEWILTPGNSPSEIRKAFQLVSRSAVRASQTAGGFSQTAAGGFGSP